MSCLPFRCSSSIYKHFPSPMHAAWPLWLIPCFSYAYLSFQIGYFLHMYPYCVLKWAEDSEVSVCLILNSRRLNWLVWWEELSDTVRYSTFITGAMPARPFGKGRQGGGKVEHWDLKGDGRWIVLLWYTWSKLGIWCEFWILCLEGCCMVKLW
jgi:hypothetical protein